MERNKKPKILGKYAFDEVCVESVGDKQCFVVEETREQLFETAWDMACDFSEDGYAPVMEGEHWGIINVMGEVVIPYRWNDIGYLSGILFPDGLCAVQDDNGHWGFIDERGDVVIPCQWADCRCFNKGCCVVEDDDGVWSFIDVKGHIVQTFPWRDVGEWSEDGKLLSVQDKNGHWGAINAYGKLMIPAEWNDSFDFEDGKASVTKGGHNYVIDKQGKVIKNLEADTPEEKSDIKERVGFAATFFVSMFFLFSSMGIGYAEYNSIIAYSLLDPSKCLGWFVAFLGGLHLYDLILPIVLAAGFLLKCHSQKDDFADFKPQREPEDTSNKGFAERFYSRNGVSIFIVFFVGSLALSSWFIFALYMAIIFAIMILVLRIILLGTKWGARTSPSAISPSASFSTTDGVILFLLIVLPLRVIYYSLFAINYFTASEPQPTEKPIIRAEKTFVPGISKDDEYFYLFIDVDDGLPYELSADKAAYYNFKSDKTSKVVANIRKGCFGYSFVSDFKTEEIAEKSLKVKSLTVSESKYIDYRHSGDTTNLRVSFTLAYHDIPELQRAVSMAFFGEDCTNVLTAYSYFLGKNKEVPVNVPRETLFPYLEISLHVDGKVPIMLHAEMTYAGKDEEYEYLCDKYFAVDPLRKCLLTVDNVLAPSEAEKVKKKANGAEISLIVDKDYSVTFSWHDGKGTRNFVVPYDGSERFTDEFRELIDSYSHR